MVKFSSLFTLFILAYLITFVTGMIIEGDCNKVYDALTAENMRGLLRDCRANTSVYTITLKGDSIDQKVIDKIASLNLHLSTFILQEIKYYPENLNLEKIHADFITFLDFPKDIPYDQLRNSYNFREYTLPKGILKSAKNAIGIHINGFKISTRTIDELSTLSNLNLLNMADCSFERGLNVRKLKNLKKLEHLFFGDLPARNSEKVHPFDGFDEGTFCQLKTLKTLVLNHSNVGKIPDCIKNLKYLEKIDLSENNIYRIPSSLSKLENLQLIVLRNNKIKEIPNHMSNLKKLRLMYLENNLITAVPEFIGQLPGLQRIFLSNNKVTSVPNSVKNKITI